MSRMRESVLEGSKSIERSRLWRSLCLASSRTSCTGISGKRVLNRHDCLVDLLRGRSRGPSKRLNCALFVFLNVKDPVQARHPEKIHQRLMEVYQLQLTTLLAKCCMSSDQLSDAGGVHVVDFIQIQNDPLIPGL